jgi:hypothetical protein
MQYMHHLGIFVFTLKLGGILHSLTKFKSNTIPALYCDNILNHGTNEGIVKLVTLMVKGNEIITKMKVLQLHVKTLFK